MLLLIGVYSLLNKNRPSPKETAFQVSLIVALFAIINNIFSIYAIQDSTLASIRMNYYFNTFYYASVALLAALISLTTYMTLLDVRYHHGRLRIAFSASSFFLILELALVLANLKTGWLFYFDENNLYHRGPLNSIGVAFLAIAIVNVVFFYVLWHKHVRKSMRLIIYTLPSIAAILGWTQYLFPHTILTGTIIGFSLLTLFITGQQQRARIDALTEISTREAFFTELTRLTLRTQPFHVILLRLRNFKTINVQHGQRAGDRVLSMVAQFLSQTDLRALTYRVQGAEFALIVTKMNDNDYETFFTNLANRFSQTWQVEGNEVILQALLTDILCPNYASSVDELMGSLEYAMLVAKKERSGKPIRFDARLQTEFRRRTYIAARMENALREDSFFLNFQPVYNTFRQQFSGGEVLLRLNEENGRPISPSEFIPIAIESGIATQLGKMVMKKTCQFLKANAHVNVGWLSINVSAQQDEFDDTVRHLEMLLDQYQVDPCRIKLEITELVLLDDLERARNTMDELNKRGIGVYLDDFGTGYSNLVNVMTLPFQCVKIDKGFIRDLTDGSKGYTLLKTVVSGLQSMQVSVLAEGVETFEQDQIVRKLGIEQIQGYFYARPMLDEEFLWLFSQHQPIVASDSCLCERVE
jgi:diguanylate cyclase (GGDEF)-like protein